VMTKFWVANNIIAIAFTIHCIENWLVGNIKYIAFIFAGLICYDVYFVFASDVMMTVARGVELPIKILFPAGNN
jgi:minor histocompatibility antigen H13